MARQRLSHDQRDVDDRSAEDRAERDQEAHLAPRIVRPEQASLAQPRREREADQADDDRRHADASADDHPGAEGRGGKRDGAEEGDAGLLGGERETRAEAEAGAELRDRAAQHRRVGKRAQDVGDREPRWVLELHAVDDERRVEHAQPDAEHADAQEVGDELPGRRLGEPEPDHRLDKHAHRGHTGDRSRHRLHVIRAVLAGRPIAEGHHAPQDPRQHLAADEEAEREVHVRGGDPAERAEDEDGDDAEQDVIAARVDRRQEAQSLGHVSYASPAALRRKPARSFAAAISSDRSDPPRMKRMPMRTYFSMCGGSYTPPMPGCLPCRRQASMTRR